MSGSWSGRASAREGKASEEITSCRRSKYGPMSCVSFRFKRRSRVSIIALLGPHRRSQPRFYWILLQRKCLRRVFSPPHPRRLANSNHTSIIFTHCPLEKPLTFQRVWPFFKEKDPKENVIRTSCLAARVAVTQYMALSLHWRQLK